MSRPSPTQLNQALYQVTASGAQPSATGQALAPATNALTFHYAANGLDVVKTFRFDSSYVITVEAQVTRNGVPVRALVQWPSGLGDMEEFLPSSLDPQPDAHSAFAVRLVAGRQAGLAGRRQGQQQRHPRTALRVRRHHRSLLCRGLPA